MFLTYGIIAAVGKYQTLLVAQAFASLSLVSLVTAPLIKLVFSIPNLRQAIGCLERGEQFCLKEDLRNRWYLFRYYHWQSWCRASWSNWDVRTECGKYERPIDRIQKRKYIVVKRFRHRFGRPEFHYPGKQNHNDRWVSWILKISSSRKHHRRNHNKTRWH